MNRQIVKRFIVSAGLLVALCVVDHDDPFAFGASNNARGKVRKQAARKSDNVLLYDVYQTAVACLY